MLRGGATREEIGTEIARVWTGRADRGAEIRAEQPGRGVFVPVELLRKDTHLEMHTRGG